MADITPAGWVTISLVLLVGLLLLLSQTRKLRTRDWVEIGILLALAFALKYLSTLVIPNFRIWAQGGSITLASMAPLFYLGLRRGWVVGAMAGIVFGLFDFLLAPFFFHPVQFLLDYPLAFGLLGGLAGAFRKPFWLGILLGGLGRLFCHFLSGVIFFSSYAPPGWNVWLYSLAYNASYMLPEIVISTMVMAIVWPRLKWTDAETGH